MVKFDERHKASSNTGTGGVTNDCHCFSAFPLTSYKTVATTTLKGALANLQSSHK
jgi:hypothetical protein